MISTIERCMKKLFARFGLDVSYVGSSSSIHPIQSTHKHNSLAYLNRFYADTSNVDAYLNRNRIHFYHMVLKTLETHVETIRGKSVVDVGCGPGGLLGLFDACSPRSKTGFEYSDAAVIVARRMNPDADIIRHDVYDQPSDTFDIVCCTEVIEHLLYPDMAIANLLAMLNVGGTLIITVPDGRKDCFPGHFNFWSSDSWDVFIRTHCKQFKYTTGMIGDTNLYAVITNTNAVGNQK